MSDIVTKFTPSMIGQLVEVTVIHSRHTGQNYYSSKIEDLTREPYGGRLAEYSGQSFTFEPVGSAAPTVVTWHYAERQREWPENGYRVEIRVAAPVEEVKPEPTSNQEADRG